MKFSEFFANPDLGGDDFGGPTWWPWLVVGKGMYGEPLLGEEFSFLQSISDLSEPPTKPCVEFYGNCGRRSGKSRFAARVAVYEAFFNPYQAAPGELPCVGVAAVDRSQALVELEYIRAMVEPPLLKQMVEANLQWEIRLNNGRVISVMTATSPAVRGRTYLAFIMDEAAFHTNSDGLNNGLELKRAVIPALMGRPFIAISSPYAKSGIMWEAHKKYYGVGGDILVIQAPSLVMNRGVDQSVITRAKSEDLAAALAEWEAQYRDDVASFLDLGPLEACVVTGRHELPPRLAAVPRLTYQAFCDPSGGKRDAAGLAICHREGEVVVVDLCRRWASPHIPSSVVAEQAEILKSYGISKVVGDKYAGSWPSDEFSKHGIRYEPSDRDKSRIYLDFLPLVMSGNVQLLDNRTLISELRSLERRTRSGGRDSVDHPPGPKQHDDLANSVAGCATITGRPKRIAGPLLRSRSVDVRVFPAKPEPAPLHPRLQYPKTEEIPSGGRHNFD